MEKELIKEIPCLPLDKLMSIFKPDKDDVYRHGLLIGRRSAVGGEHADISFVQSVIENKRAYDAWAAYARQREIDKGIQEAR